MKTIVSERGQITLPKVIRDELGIKAGTILEFEIEKGRIVVMKSDPDDPIAAWRGRGRLPQGFTSVDAYLREIRQ
jgi:AbrB family looped-hinge helix DNA binding protein